MEKVVSVRYCEDYSIEEVSKTLDTCFADIGGLNNIIKPKTKVMLKCNLATNSQPNNAKTTHPSVVIAIAEKLAKLGASCVIADCPESSGMLNKIYETTQMLYASNQGNAELNLDETVTEENIDGVKTKKLTLMQLVNEVDYIVNIPKLIIDPTFVVKGAVDNLFGLVPSEMQDILKDRLMLPKDYNNYLLDILSVVQNKTILNILDGVVASEIDGTQRIMNVIMTSTDTVCLDAVVYNMLGLDTKDYSLFQEAQKRNFFDLSTDIVTVGDNLAIFKKQDLMLVPADPDGQKSKFSAKKRKQIYLSSQQRPKVYTNKCKGCKKCFLACPVGAISENRDENGEIYAKINLGTCINCLRCVRTCPYQAINVVTPIKYKNMRAKIDKRLTRKK